MAGRTITISFGGNAAGVQRAARQAERAVDSVGARVARVSRVVGGVVALGAAMGAAGAHALALAASAQSAVGAIGLLPGVIAATTAAVFAARAVTFGLGEAWTATGKAAASGGGSASGAARQVAAAQRQVRSATKALADAQRDAKRAQEDVTRARAEEVRRLADLARSVRDARLDEEGAARDLAAAEKELARARSTGDPEAIAEADYQYRRQLATVDNVRARLAELETEQTEAQRKGVNGSDAVREALDRQREAQDRVTEAAERLTEAQEAVRQSGARAAGGGIDPAAQALARLAPNARAVILTLRQLVPAWEGAARAGQQRTFAGVAGDLRDLSGIYLPRASRFLLRMGSAFNVAIRQSLGLFKTRAAARDVDAILGATARSTDRLARAVRPVINGLLQWAAVGVGFLPQFAGDVGSIAQRFEAWSVAARESGQAQQWMSTAVTVLRQLAAVAVNVVATVRGIVAAGDDGGGTLDWLVRASAAMRAWVESGEGQERVASVLEKLRGIISGLASGAQGAENPLSALMDTIKVGGVVMGFLADHADTVAKALPYLATGFILLKAAQIGSNVAAVASVPIQTAQVIVNRRLAASIAAQTAAMGVNRTATVAAAAATGVATTATVAGDVATKRSIVSMAAQRVAMVATSVATKAWAAAQWLINAAMSANPVGIVIIAIVALVAAIVLAYQRSETFRKIVDGAFRAVAAAGKWLWENVLRPAFQGIGTAIVWVKDRVVASVNGWIVIFRTAGRVAGEVRAAIVDRFTRLVNFVAAMPGRIRSAASGLWDGIKDAFRAAVNWIIDRWNNLELRLPSVDVPGFGRVGGGAIQTPNIPRLAAGGRARPGRTYLVGERGPELFSPDGLGTVTPNNQLGGHTEVRVFIGERELTDIVRVEVSEANRGVRRRALAGAGAR